MSEVSLKQLRCFVAVYAERNFTKAATLLNMKQSPVSQAIATLERQLNQQLFVRMPREVIPTAAADVLYPEALELRRRAESLPRLIAETQEGKAHHRIRLGAVSSVFPSMLAGVLSALDRFSVVVSDGTGANLEKAVNNGDIDICITRGVNGERTEERVAFRERLLVAVPAGHRLADHVDLTPEEIVNEPVITFNRDVAPLAFDLVASVFLQAGSQMRVAAHLSSEQGMLGLVRAGGGISLVSQTVGLGQWEGIKLIPLRGAQPTYPLTVRTAPGDPLGLLEPVTAAVIDWAQEHGISHSVSS